MNRLARRLYKDGSSVGAFGGEATDDATSNSNGSLGARHVPHYHDRHEDYVPVSRPVLLELSVLGWLQEGAGAVGTFFFSGAFSLLGTMLFEHANEITKFIPWVILCFVSMLFGTVLMWVGYHHFLLKQQRIHDIFRENLPIR